MGSVSKAYLTYHRLAQMSEVIRHVKIRNAELIEMFLWCFHLKRKNAAYLSHDILKNLETGGRDIKMCLAQGCDSLSL